MIKLNRTELDLTTILILNGYIISKLAEKCILAIIVIAEFL